MRARRYALFVAVLAAVAAVSIVAANANAGTASALRTAIARLQPPSTPYSAIALDSIVPVGPVAHDVVRSAPNDTVSVSPYGTGIQVYASGNTDPYIILELEPLTTQTQFATGTYALKYGTPDATHLGSWLTVSDGGVCSYLGTMTISEVTYTSNGIATSVSTLAADFSASCGGGTFFGEVRYNSSAGFVAGTRDKTSLNFGTQPLGHAADGQTVTITSQGSGPLNLGAATIGGADPSAFAITGDTCSGAELTFGQTCTVTVAGTPAAAGAHQASLTIPDNTPAGQRTVGLLVTGDSFASVAASPTFIDFGTIERGQPSANAIVTFTSQGTIPATFGAASLVGYDPASFAIKADTCSSQTLAVGASCTIAVAAQPQVGDETDADVLIAGNFREGQVGAQLRVIGKTPAGGTYYPLTPTRLLDTRSGLGAPKAAVGPNGRLRLQVTGRGGVPATGVGAVVLNVTVTSPTTRGHLTVFPSGSPLPNASSLNFVAGWTGANSVTVKVGAGGQVDIGNSAGSTQVIVDVAGFFANSDDVLPTLGIGGQLQPVTPRRVLDTRVDDLTGVPHGAALPAGWSVTLPISFDATTDPHVRAFAVNITALKGTQRGFLTAWDGTGAAPGTSTLNFVAGATVSNMAIVPTARCAMVIAGCDQTPSITIGNNSTGATHILVDVIGIFDDSHLPGGLRFDPINPTRVVDTRVHQGIISALGPGVTAPVAPPVTVIGPDAQALSLNLTAVSPTANTYLELWPRSPAVSRPTVSTVDPQRGVTVANAAICALGAGGMFNVFNLAGTTNVIIDVNGVFEAGLMAGATEHLSGPPTLTPTRPRSAPLAAAATQPKPLAHPA